MNIEFVNDLVTRHYKPQIDHLSLCFSSDPSCPNETEFKVTKLRN